VHPLYYRGGALVLPVAFSGAATGSEASLLLHTSMTYPVALDEGGWKKAGREPKSFAPMPGVAGLTWGTLDYLRLGAFELNQIPGVYGAPVDEVEKAAGAELDGFAGSGLIATFRLTFADGGRTLWVEDLPAEVIAARREESERARALGAARAAVPETAAPASVAPAPAASDAAASGSAAPGAPAPAAPARGASGAASTPLPGAVGAPASRAPGGGAPVRESGGRP
jgi:hypothetical protein